MGSSKLKEDLNNCLINFDRRVLITELLDDYRLSYDEVNTIVQNYVVEQEDKLKFEKKYLVHGLHGDEPKKEIYKVVEEKKVKEWLKKLKNAESSLYSIEIEGGAKSPAPIFKPMRIEECVKAIRQKTSAPNVEAKGSATAAVEKKEANQEKDVGKMKESSEEAEKIIPKKESATKKTSPKTEISPPEKKASIKKGINNFFTPSNTMAKKSEDNKPTSGVVKPPTPKKMQDFFKKQTKKPEKIEKHENATANKSMQLFDEEDVLDEGESSDEEEKLEALKRDIISSDVEVEVENENKASAGKRRRILDSDDEEDPPVKQEKLELKEEVEVKEEEAVAETYLDEDGFVITKKPKQKPTSTTKKSTDANKRPAVTMKTSPKEAKKSTSSSKKETKSSKTATAKTKQAGIMNFFSKK